MCCHGSEIGCFQVRTSDPLPSSSTVEFAKPASAGIMMPSRWKSKTSPKTRTPRFFRSTAAVLRSTHGQLPGSPLNQEAAVRSMDVDTGCDYQESSSPLLLKTEFETPCRPNRSSLQSTTRQDELMLHQPSSPTRNSIEDDVVEQQCPLTRAEIKRLQTDLDAFYALDVNGLSIEQYRHYILVRVHATYVFFLPSMTQPDASSFRICETWKSRGWSRPTPTDETWTATGRICPPHKSTMPLTS